MATISPAGITVSALPSFREFVNAAFKDRRAITATVITTLAISLIVAILMPANYAASTSLLVLPSTDYQSQAPAGQPVITSASLERQEILPTEIEILSNPTLHAEVIRTIGLANLYPGMVKPPSLLAQIQTSIKTSIKAFVASLTSGEKKAPPPPPDPALRAVPAFDANLTLTALKEGSIIEVTFKHKDPQIAADAVNTLIALYLKHRQTLYRDVESNMVLERVNDLHQRMDMIGQDIADFKLQHSIYDFAAQQTILLTQRAELEKDLNDANNVIGQLSARLPVLQHELAATPIDVVQFNETNKDLRTVPLRTNIDTLVAQEATMASQFKPGSRPLVEIQNQVAKLRQELAVQIAEPTVSDLRTGRNNNYDLLSLELAHARSDLDAALARRDTDQRQLAAVAVKLAGISEDEAALNKLTNQQLAAVQSYQDMVKQYDMRREQEEVEKGRSANVRAISPALPPLQPINLTPLVLAGGLVLSLLLGTVVALLSEGRRAGFLSAEKLERSLGLTVLVAIPDRAVVP